MKPLILIALMLVCGNVYAEAVQDFFVITQKDSILPRNIGIGTVKPQASIDINLSQMDTKVTKIKIRGANKTCVMKVDENNNIGDEDCK